MGQRYSQLGLEERIEIARLSAQGCSIRQIAAALDRAPSSVARELKHNSGAQVGYKPVYADEQTRARRWSGSRLDRDDELHTDVLAQLHVGWSPEQIAGRARLQGKPLPSSLARPAICSGDQPPCSCASTSVRSSSSRSSRLPLQRRARG